MSLVGPRPALPEEAAKYGDYVRRRLAVRPGLTGLWQVNGRSDLSWDEAVRLDLRYVENWSFASTCRSCGRPGPRWPAGMVRTELFPRDRTPSIMVGAIFATSLRPALDILGILSYRIVCQCAP